MINKQQILWRCRRGMLELDLFLGTFVENQWEDLSSQDRELLIELLEESDQDLFGWLMGHKEPLDRYKALIARIRQYPDGSADGSL